MEDMRYDRKTEEINRKVYLLSDQVHIYNKHTQKALRLLSETLFHARCLYYMLHQQPRLSATQALIKANRLLSNAFCKLYVCIKNGCRRKLIRQKICKKGLFQCACLVLLIRVLQNSLRQRQKAAVLNLPPPLWAWHTYRADRLKTMMKPGRYHYRSALDNSSHGASQPMPFKSARRRLCGSAPSARPWSGSRTPARLQSTARDLQFAWGAFASLQLLEDSKTTRFRRRKGTALCFGWMWAGV